MKQINWTTKPNVSTVEFNTLSRKWESRTVEFNTQQEAINEYSRLVRMSPSIRIHLHYGTVTVHNYFAA